MSALTATVAVLLTVNMIIERREFLEMLTESENARTILNQEFKTGLVGIRRFSKRIRDAQRLELDAVRRFAAEVNRTAEQLDGMVEEMLDADGEEGCAGEVDRLAPAAEGVGL